MSAIHLLVTTEGKTEGEFVRRVLAPHLARFAVFARYRSVLTGRERSAGREHRGGMSKYEKARSDIRTWMKEENHPHCRFTTMFDLYGLPTDFPGFAAARGIADPRQKVAALEKALEDDIADPRFIPYIQLHEFEALIFADPVKLDWEYIDHKEAIIGLTAMARELDPETIDDGPETAPSKRIQHFIPEYDKASAGVTVVEKIGLPTLRARCPHFSAWLQRLETLG